MKVESFFATLVSRTLLASVLLSLLTLTGCGGGICGTGTGTEECTVVDNDDNTSDTAYIRVINATGLNDALVVINSDDQTPLIDLPGLSVEPGYSDYLVLQDPAESLQFDVYTAESFRAGSTRPIQRTTINFTETPVATLVAGNILHTSNLPFDVPDETVVVLTTMASTPADSFDLQESLVRVIVSDRNLPKATLRLFLVPQQGLLSDTPQFAELINGAAVVATNYTANAAGLYTLVLVNADTGEILDVEDEIIALEAGKVFSVFVRENNLSATPGRSDILVINDTITR